MKIRFELDKEDVWEFNKYAIYNIPKVRNKFWRNIILIPVVALVTCYLMEVSKTYTAIAFVATPIIGYFHSLSRMRINVIKAIYSNKGILCEHTIKMNEEGLREITPVNEIFHTWKEIKSVKESKEHVYVFVDNVMAHIIPKRSFPSELQCQEFIKRSQEFIENEK